MSKLNILSFYNVFTICPYFFVLFIQFLVVNFAYLLKCVTILIHILKNSKTRVYNIALLMLMNTQNLSLSFY